MRKFLLMEDTIPCGKSGNVEIRRKVIGKKEMESHLLAHLMSQDPVGADMRPGTYTILLVDGEVMMSDTPLETKTNRDVLEKANGDVLIAGLGIGVILRPLLEDPDIRSITVIEKSPDVIKLVAPHVAHPKLTIIEDDIFKWAPTKGQRWDTIYFDIWQHRDVENLKEMAILHQRFKFKLNRENPRRWMHSWYKEYLLDQRRRERYEERMWASYPWSQSAPCIVQEAKQC